MSVTVKQGDCRDVLATMPAQSVHCCVTSPPYFGLRDYGTAQWEGGDAECDHKQGRPGSDRADGVVGLVGHRNRDGVGSFGGDCKHCGAIRVDSQIGLESTPDVYVSELVAVFRDVRRVLRDDGTLWLNLGDSYSPGGRTTQIAPTLRTATHDAASGKQAYLANFAVRPKGDAWSKPKDLLGIPWRVAFALQADGWYLRQDIIWSKPNPMPESVTDRCTKAHEYIFLMSKSAKYYYDAAAIAEPVSMTNGAQAWRRIFDPTKQEKEAELKNGGMKGGNDGNRDASATHRNRRSVWEVASQPFAEAHFATFPPALIEPCIKAGCPAGGTVLDPFGGAGTTGLVADRLGRDALLIELNPEYAGMIERRMIDDAGMFANVEIQT